MIQRSGWLIDSLPRIFDSKHFIWIVTLVCVLVVLPTPATGNQCLVGGVYINVTANGTTIVNAPENGTLQDVGNKTCGFQISGRIVDVSCQRKYTVQFVAVDMKEGETPFCNFWRQKAICVCNVFGCNSVTGVLYETLLKAIGRNGKIVGEDYSSASGFYQIDSQADIATDCILDRIQDAYNDTTTVYGRRIKAKLLRVDPSSIADWEQDNAGYFPNQTAIDKLLQLEISLRPTTTTTTTLPPPTNNPASPDSPNQQNNLNSAGGAGGGSDKKIWNGQVRNNRNFRGRCLCFTGDNDHFVFFNL